MEITLQDLHEFDGKKSDKIYVSLLGIVYDCTEGGHEFFVDGPYHVFAGRDASYALAMMSLDVESVDRFEYELDSDDLQTLSEWIAYFDARYVRAGWLTGRSHPVRIDQLPPVPKKKMGDTEYGGNPNQATEQAALQADLEKVSREAGGSNARASKAGAGESKLKGGRLSQILFQSTKVQHTRALRGEFMGKCMNGSIDRQTYATFVASLYYVYQELEQQLDQHKDDELVKAIHTPSVLRLANLKEDLEHFYGDEWETVLPSPTLWAIRYVSRIHDTAADAHRLVVHHWMRYGGGLAGGQFLRTSLARGLGLRKSAEDTTPGIRYHQFESLELPIQEHYEWYLGQLDGLAERLTDKQLEEMVEEAQIAFDMNINLNDDIMDAVSKL
jgi:heme oxygenase